MTSAVVAVHKSTAIGPIAQFVVSELVRAVFTRDGRLGAWSATAVYIDRVLAWVGKQVQLIVEQKSIGAEFTLGVSFL